MIQNRLKSMVERYQTVRGKTVELVSPLEKEDFIVQSIPDVSPPKWHIAHTTWFFEKFILKEYKADYQEFDPVFNFLFNSYYETVGPFQPRHQRGVLSRPTVDEVLAFRTHVDTELVGFLSGVTDDDVMKAVTPLLEIGLQHEQQHQELILMDVKYNFFVNPIHPVYQQTDAPKQTAAQTEMKHFEGGLVEIGHSGDGFAFDNESPRHKVWLEPFKLASAPVTNGEFLAFIEAGGYERPVYWLSDGWNEVKKEGWKAPLYWMKEGDDWKVFTLGGVKPLDLDEPVCHVSYYEADAYARWCEKRLPTEEEWEHAASQTELKGNTMDDGIFHPVAKPDGGGQFGDTWEWTMSGYTPYPGTKPLEGALGEYNAKFMCNQMILRGGACVTPASHMRLTYRNFFPANKRWQFSGIRLAEDSL